MALIQDVAVIFARPQMAGWKQLLAQHGLDLTASDLAAELNRPLPAIDRTVPGFEDLKVRKSDRVSRSFVLPLKPCGRGGIGRRIGLKRKLECSPGNRRCRTAQSRGTLNMAIPSQARPETAGKV